MTDERDWTVIEALQEGLPLTSRPYAQLAERSGMAEEEFLRRARRLQDEGVIRRIGPRVRHHRVGLQGNVMVVWRVPEDRAEEIGQLFAAEAHVSHCYLRPTFEDFPYNLYTMVHATDEEAAKALVAEMAKRSGIQDYRLLPTVRELKKISPTYRRPMCSEE